MRIHSYKFHPFSHLESGESVHSQCFQSMFRIFSSKVQISRIPGKAVLCLQQTNLGNGSLIVAERLVEWETQWDRIGWRRNQGFPARHSPDGAAFHFRGLRSTNRGSRELERLEGSLSSGRGILSSKLP